VNLFTGAPVDRDRLSAMCELLSHRGPDGQGVVVDGATGFGHRRLAVIDVTDAASQPMTSADERYWITFNGEIYNYLDLRADLAGRGHRFRTQSDTEVLLTAYREYGPRCLDRLRGMFAFAIWDRAEQRLFLARDRTGKKPLFYRYDRDGLVFASEPKAFLAEQSFAKRPNLDAIALYLAYGYVPDPWSAFEGVHKLPPAHYMVFDERGGRASRYWRLSYRDKRRVSEQEAVDHLLTVLREAVRLRLISDVPLGAFLSGGIDSSLIVALMSTLQNQQVRTFTIGFHDAQFNELEYARLVARRYETDHHEFIVNPQAAAIIPKLAWQYGEPFADSSAIPTYYLSELTRQHVTVALNGDAGDESFAGYTRYLPPPKAKAYATCPLTIRRTLAGLARRAPHWGRPSGALARAARWARAMGGTTRERYAESLMALDSTLRHRVCTTDFVSQLSIDPMQVTIDAFAGTDADGELDAMLAADIATYLPGDILVKVDIATMAHGLEGRSPFLDHVVMEYAASLPATLKLNGHRTKHVLRQAARGLIPDALLDRPKKGFSVPMSRWLREDLRELASDILLSDTAANRGITSRANVEAMLQDHIEGRYHWHVPLYTLLMLELWFRQYVDAEPGARSAAYGYPAQPAVLS